MAKNYETTAKDKAKDKKRGIKEGSRKDRAEDKRAAPKPRATRGR